MPYIELGEEDRERKRKREGEGQREVGKEGGGRRETEFKFGNINSVVVYNQVGIGIE